MSSAPPAWRNPLLDLRFIRSVEAAVEAQDIARAIQMARQGLSDGLVHPLLLNLRAFGFEMDGRLEEARDDLQRAVSLAPSDHVVQNAYGLILAKLLKYQYAVDAFEESVRLAPDFPQARYNLGWSLGTTGDLAGAQESLEKAVELKPDFADAWSWLSQIVYRRGDFARALDLAGRALTLDPKQHHALNTQAQIALAEQNYDRAGEILDGLLSDETLPPRERVQTLGLMGDLLHAKGRYEEAFTAYETTNEEDRALYAARFDAPDVETAYAYAVWLAEYFDAAPAAEWSAENSRRNPPEESLGGAAGHVFLVGFPRSGTTLLENVLASHPAIVALEEKATLSDATLAFFNNARGRERLRVLSAEDAAQQRGLYWQHVRKFNVDPNGKIFIDKNPLNSMKLPIVARLFPAAKVIFALRDPRDVVLSCFRRTFMMNASMFEFTTLERSARFYDAVMRLSELYREKLGLPWHVLRHESLVDDFEAETRKICDFIGVDWSGEMGEFAERARNRVIATPSAIQVMRGLTREGVGYWRNYRTQMAPVLPILAPWVEKFGYPAE